MSEQAIYWQGGYMDARRGLEQSVWEGAAEANKAEYERGYQRGLEHEQFREEHQRP